MYPVYTNKTVSGNFRGPEFPQGCFGIQSMMDDVAFRMEMDPVDFILKNMTRKFRDETPHTNFSLDECIRRGMEAFDWKRRWHPPGADRGPIRRGSGVAFLAFRAGLGRSNAVIRLDASGQYRARRRHRRRRRRQDDDGVDRRRSARRAAIADRSRLGRHRSLPVLGRRIGQPDDDHDRRRRGRGGARSQETARREGRADRRAGRADRLRQPEPAARRDSAQHVRRALRRGRGRQSRRARPRREIPRRPRLRARDQSVDRDEPDQRRAR